MYIYGLSQMRIYLFSVLFLLISSSSVYSQVGLPGFDESVKKIKILGCATKGSGESPSIDSFNRGRILGLGTIIGAPILANLNIDPRLWLRLTEDCNELNKIFGVDSPMYLIQEEGAPNAFATSNNLSGVYSRDGTVFFGYKLLIDDFQSNNGFGIPTILAHEYGHILQFKNNFPNFSTHKWRELHADYLAGWYTAYRSRFRNQVPLASLSSVYTKGDYAFNSVDHHGTPNERAFAFNAGYMLHVQGGVMSGHQAYENGIEFVKAMGAPFK